MSVLDELPLRRGSGRVLMLGTVVLAAAAAAVLATVAQDVRLLRLGLVAALWAALLGAFAAARMRREISSDASRVDELRTVYQLELEREVAARREHTLTVERELREQAEQAEQREIAALRAELAAMRANLEKLMDEDLMVEATRSLTATGSSVRPPGGPLLGSPDLRGPLEQQVRADLSPVGSALPTSDWPVNGRSETALTDCENPELRFGPGRRYSPVLVTSTQVWESAPICWDDVISPPQGSGRNNGRHGTPSRESPGSHSNGSHSNGSHSNGSHSNGGGARRVAQETPAIGAQRSVNDLLAAHGVGSPPRRRRSREDNPQA